MMIDGMMMKDDERDIVVSVVSQKISLMQFLL